MLKDYIRETLIHTKINSIINKVYFSYLSLIYNLHVSIIQIIIIH